MTQWLHSRMTKYFSVQLGYHCCVFTIYLMSFMYDFVAMDSWDYSYMGRLKFATFWNSLLHVLYYFVCVVVDIHLKTIVPSEQQGPRWRLQRVRDTLHTSIIFPFGTFCALSFWGLYFKDRELVYPQRLDTDLTCSIILSEEQIKRWKEAINIGRKVNSLVIKHSLTLVFTMCDKILVHHQYPRLFAGICYSACFPLFYSILLCYLGFQKGIWVYPFMRHLDITERFTCILACFVPIAILQVIGKTLTASLWREAVNKKNI